MSRAEWSPDGTRILTRGGKTARIWLVDWPDIRAKLWHQTNDYLRAHEREEYLGELPETAAAREAEDRGWIEAKVAAEREVRPLPAPPR